MTILPTEPGAVVAKPEGYGQVLSCAEFFDVEVADAKSLSYIIVPSTFTPKEKKAFQLNVWSDCDFKCVPLPAREKDDDEESVDESQSSESSEDAEDAADDDHGETRKKRIADEQATTAADEDDDEESSSGDDREKHLRPEKSRRQKATDLLKKHGDELRKTGSSGSGRGKKIKKKV